MIEFMFLHIFYGLTASLLIGGIFVGRDLWKNYIDAKRIWAAIDEISKEKKSN